MTPGFRAVCPVLAAVFVLACGGDAGESESGAATPASGSATAVMTRSVEISSPADGSEVEGPSLTVNMEARGFTVAPAGDSTPNSGHLHLFLDRDLSLAGIPIPTEENYVVHLGKGTRSYTFEVVSPGEHRMIAVVGDALHVPLQPWVVDTVFFTVR